MVHVIAGDVDMAAVHAQNFGFRVDSSESTEKTVRDGLETLVGAQMPGTESTPLSTRVSPH